MKLMTSQKNYLFDIIESSKFSPSQFKIEETIGIVDAEKDTIVRYLNSSFFFNFQGSLADSRTCKSRFSPGNSSVVEEIRSVAWSFHVDHFNAWLQYLEREITIPNKWERLEKEMKQIGVTFDDNNDKFTAFEYEDLKQRMSILKEGIKNIGVSPDQIKILEAKIDHLTEMALTMNKFDWKSMLVGTIISLTIELTFNEQSRKSFYDLIKLVLSPIIQLP